MDVKVFFEKAKAICGEHSDEECPCCPLNEFCESGIFAENRDKTDRLIDLVKDYEIN